MSSYNTCRGKKCTLKSCKGPYHPSKLTVQNNKRLQRKKSRMAKIKGTGNKNDDIICRDRSKCKNINCTFFHADQTPCVEDSVWGVPVKCDFTPVEEIDNEESIWGDYEDKMEEYNEQEQPSLSEYETRCEENSVWGITPEEEIENKQSTWEDYEDRLEDWNEREQPSLSEYRYFGQFDSLCG
jgi:hypothetical protein